MINDGVLEYGRSLASDGNADTIACLFRNDGTLVGGGLGRTEYNRLFVSALWVLEERRGQGIGRQIIHRMEQEAISRGCRDALIETLIEQNMLLYDKLGYKCIAVVPNYVGNFTRFIMLKTLMSSDT